MSTTRIDGRVDEAVDHRVQDRAEQLRPAPDRRHHRVLERALPALDGDRLGDPAEDDRQVVPEDRPDHQRQEQARVALVGTDERDRERARDGVDEEGDLPAPVAAGQEEVALDEGVRRLQLMGDDESTECPFRRVRPARSLSGTGRGESSLPRGSGQRIASRRAGRAARATGRAVTERARASEAGARRRRGSPGSARGAPGPPRAAARCEHVVSFRKVVSWRFDGLSCLSSSRHLLSVCQSSASSSSSTSSSRERPV